jgi:hypothetical protein
MGIMFQHMQSYNLLQTKIGFLILLNSIRKVSQVVLLKEYPIEMKFEPQCPIKMVVY